MAGWESGPKRTPQSDILTGVAAGAIGIGFWLPLSFHTIEDLSKDPSRPILDTDYRFGAQLGGQPWFRRRSTCGIQIKLS